MADKRSWPHIRHMVLLCEIKCIYRQCVYDGFHIDCMKISLMLLTSRRRRCPDMSWWCQVFIERYFKNVNNGHRSLICTKVVGRILPTIIYHFISLKHRLVTSFSIFVANFDSKWSIDVKVSQYLTKVLRVDSSFDKFS